MPLDPAELAREHGLRLRRTLVLRATRVVAQVADGSGHLFALKADGEPGALAGDVAAIETLAAVGVPVPEIVAYQTGHRDVLIMSWIDGEPISSSAPVAAQHEAGRILCSVHDLPGGPPFSGQRSVADWIAAWTDEVASWWPTVGGTPEQVGQLTHWVAELRPVLTERAGTLTLFDGRAEHVLMRDGHVAGLIDLHDVGSGDPAMDLAVLTLTDELLLPGVLQGYGADRAEREALDRLIPFYWLLCRLAGAEWQLRVGNESEAGRLLQLVGASSVVGDRTHP